MGCIAAKMTRTALPLAWKIIAIQTLALVQAADLRAPKNVMGGDYKKLHDLVRAISPKLENEVSVHYEGKLINGKIFDSSIKRGEPATFGVGQVIPGWTEALQRMKVGDKWRLFIPPNIAYGERGAGGDIGPNEALVFEVELLEVK